MLTSPLFISWATPSKTCVSSFICWVLKLSSWDWLERQKKTKICLSPLCHGCVALTADEGKDHWRIRARPSSFVLMAPAVGVGGWAEATERATTHVFTAPHTTITEPGAGSCAGRWIRSLPWRSLGERSKTNDYQTVLDCKVETRAT